jgi:hypothetical protein
MAIAGKLKCLDSLGRWEEAIQLCVENLDHLRVECVASGSKTHTKAAVIGARSGNESLISIHSIYQYNNN